ncbi:MurR/RpiR family transcriptional regulator [Qingshengfaniella alkalisoli]|uniref:MurR/RpiR family transcriptional regulator n=1 Tax=Qingshengfaniella alkalisoli TaxID=2599296 RepID=A0A5B8J295_9RHOB|nr:MurR/RpiR family transcriptional regulator [Qingshengfaniella alkalisoli]QDY70908.1 MurR/RpiR family transcriptional regulator [Qingshengfaniella alkalisoli]
MADLLARLQTLRGSLSKGERQLDEVITSDAAFAVNASITELAARAGVSPATVTRFARHLGCDSFTALKVQLAQAMFVGQRYVSHADANMTAPDVISIAEQVHHAAQQALSETRDELSPKAIQTAAERIASARLVACFGSGGASSMIAAEIQNRLFRLGLAANSSTDHQMQIMQAATLAQGDVVVAASLSGRNQELVKALHATGEYGAFRIALTRPDRPVAEAADLLIAIDHPEHGDILRPTASRYAFLLVTDLLATTVAHLRDTHARECLRRVKLNLALGRDTDDKEALGD